MRKLNSIEKKRLYKILARCTIVLLAGLLYYLFVQVTGIKIPCVFSKITGLSCPGCGITGMAMALLSLDIEKAFQSQPAIFCSILPLTICFVAQAIRYVKEGKTKLSKWQNIVLWMVIVVLILFCVYKNIKTCYPNW